MARCRVCHRELTNAAHIAAGIGPICAQRATRFGVGTGRGEQVASYPAARLARIERALARLGQMIEQAHRYGFDSETLALVIHWYERWQRIERRVKQCGRIASVRAA
jgi:hypothetical protein